VREIDIDRDIQKDTSKRFLPFCSSRGILIMRTIDPKGRWVDQNSFERTKREKSQQLSCDLPSTLGTFEEIRDLF
jgi:hypothetical protein